MLVLTRKTAENVVIDGRIIVRVLRVDGDSVKLGIEAPAEVSVHRQEVYLDIQQSNKEAATPTRRLAPKLDTSVLRLVGSEIDGKAAHSGRPRQRGSK